VGMVLARYFFLSSFCFLSIIWYHLPHADVPTYPGTITCIFKIATASRMAYRKRKRRRGWTKPCLLDLKLVPNSCHSEEQTYMKKDSLPLPVRSCIKTSVVQVLLCLPPSHPLEKQNLDRLLEDQRCLHIRRRVHPGLCHTLYHRQNNKHQHTTAL
jgi:hypothetical protein